MGKQRKGMFEVGCHADYADLYAVSFLGSEASTALQHQDEAIVSSVTRSSDGVYVLALSARYKRIYVVGVNVETDTVDWIGRGHTVTEGGDQDNAVTIQTEVAGAADDSEAAVTVLLYLVLAGGS